MERFLTVVLVLFSVASSASAWSFTWRNEDGKAYVVHQSEPIDCEKIEQAAGEEFRWHPEDDGLSIWLFENDQCAGYRAGYSPDLIWERVSSRDLLSFRVASEDDANNSTSTDTTTSTSTTTTTTSTSTSTAASSPTSTSTPTETPTSEPSESETSNGSSVPAGAVAGGVVGGVAGLAVIGGLFFFLGRRKRTSQTEPAPQESGPDNPPASAHSQTPPPPTPMYGDATGFPPHDPEGKSELDSAPVYQLVAPGYADEVVKQPYSPLGSSGTQAHQPPARMMAELPGDEVMMVEMSDSHRLNELEGNETPKR